MTSCARRRRGSRRQWGQVARSEAVRLTLVLVIVGTALAIPPGGRSVLAAGAAPVPTAVHQTSDVGQFATLQRLLVEHVYVTGFLAKTILDGRQEQLQATIDAVDANSRALADQIGQAYGPGVREAFLTAWRTRIGLYVDYAFGAATGDDAKKGAALNRLDDARGNIDVALTGVDPHLSPGLVAELLRPQVRQIIGAIDAFAAGDTPGAYASLQTAAAGVTTIADLIAAPVASTAQQPVAAPSVPPLAPIAVAPPSTGRCTVAGPASRYVTTLGDFGMGGASFLKQRDDSYWGGNGLLVGFERDEGDAFQSSPWGGYIISGVVITADEREAAGGLVGTVQGWTADWRPYDAGPWLTWATRQRSSPA